MPPLPPAPGPARKRKSTGTSSHSKSRSRSKSQAQELPVIGWIMGLGIGGVLSLIVILWVSWATSNSRAFLPAARALAAKDAPQTLALLDPYCQEFQGNRFLERREMISAPYAILSSAVVATKDRVKILATVSRHELADAQIGSDSSAAKIAQTADGVAYPLLMPGDRIKYGWLPRMACLAEDWKLVIDTAREGLGDCDRFWNQVGGVPVPSSERVLSSGTTALGQKDLERRLHVTLIWALAQSGEYDAALSETEQLLAEPLAYQDTFSCIRPELLFLRAAIEAKLGQSQQAQQTYQAAQQAYDTPIVFDYGQPERSQPAKLPTPPWHYPLRAKSVVESWQGLREQVFGFPQRWFGDKHSSLWSFRENPRDFTDDFIDGLQTAVPAP